MPIQTIVFDLGRTLVHFDWRDLEPHMAHCRDQFFQLSAQYEIGQLTWEQFQPQACALLRQPAGQFQQWFCSIFDLNPLIQPAVISALRQRYRVGLLSNTNQNHYHFLRTRLPWLDQLDFHTLSYEVGACKPAAAIYRDVETKAVCAPGEILYFDDIPLFVETARERGWNAEVFANERQALDCLRNYGVVLDPLLTRS